MNALVTGAGGFLGLYIVEQLVARGDGVRAFCRRPHAELDALGVETVLGDLCDREAVVAACRGVDVVFHVGGVAGLAGSWKHYYAVNTLGTRHVVDGCLAQGVRRLVYASSPSVVFDGSSQEGIDESVPYPNKWLGNYPRSKALAEKHVLANNGTDGLLTCALRPHLIWGVRDRHLIPRLIQRATSGRLCRVGDGKNKIDTVYVENAAMAHVQAADALRPDSPVPGRAYFITQGEPVNCWEWIDSLLALAGLPPVTRSMSPTTARILGAAMEMAYTLFGWKGEPAMTRFLAAQLATSHYFDITRARDDFGYHPKVSTAEGMRRLADELASRRLSSQPSELPGSAPSAARPLANLRQNR